MEVKPRYFSNFLVFIFILNWIGTGFISAAPQLQVSDSLENRPEVVEFDKSFIDSFQTNEDYNYFKDLQEDSAWEKIKRWLNLQWNKFLEWLFSGISDGNVWNYISLILKTLLIIGLLVLIIWLFNKYYVTRQKKAPENKSEINLSEDERLIQQKDLSTLIEEAEAQNNYRLASRYLFLNILKHLKNQNLIAYEFQKTNSDYRNEISPEEIKSVFVYASRFYEFVWYGDFQLDATAYQKAKTRLQALISTIQNSRTYG